MDELLQEIVESADAWFQTGRTRRSGPDYARLVAALEAARNMLLKKKTAELDQLQEMAFVSDADRENDEDGEEADSG